jgi:hypothetical protein
MSDARYSDDEVDPADAALQALLMAMADRATDDDRRNALTESVLTLPPIREWPAESFDELRRTMRFVIDCAESLRRRRDAGEQ